MYIPGQRTLKNALLSTQEALYQAFNMEQITKARHQRKLVDSMGFDGQWDDHRSFQMNFLRANDLSAQMRFLEIGSGPLTLAIPLMQILDPGRYTGVDIRESVTNLAYEEIARAGLAARNPRLVVASDFGAKALGQEVFDIIWSFSVLYHLSDELVADLFANVKQRLAPDGRYWANFNDGMEDSRWLEFPFLNRNTDFYDGIARKNGLTLKILGTLEELGFSGTGAERKNIMFEICHG